jgi:hypothetical protein
MKPLLFLFIFFNCSLFAQDIPCYKTFFEDKLISSVPQMDQSAPTILLVKPNNFIATQNFDVKLDFVNKIEHVGKVFDHQKYVSEYGGMCIPKTSEGQIFDIVTDYVFNDIILNSVFGKKGFRFTSMNN